MRECDPEEPLANKLIRTRIQMTVSQSSDNESKPLMDVISGMQNVLEFMGSRNSNQGQDARKKLVDRLALIFDGQKRYAKIQMGHLETLVCCVGALGVDVKQERARIATLRKEMANIFEKTDRTLAALKDPSTPNQQLVAMVKDMRNSALQESSVSMRDIGKRLYKRADRKINLSLDKDEVVRKIAKALVKPAQGDPGPDDPI